MHQVSLIVFTMVTLLCVGNARASITYDAAADFSNTSGNPHGSWSYGSSNALGSFTPFSTAGDFAGNSALPAWLGWASGSSSGEPWVTKNISSSTAVAFGLQLDPGKLAFHPGPSGEYGIVRWTTPSSGDYSVSGAFDSSDRFSGATVDVHVLRNGTSIFDGDLVGPLGTQMPFALNPTLSAGDVIDFVVGYGSNNNFYNDSTGLAATIRHESNVVPEPTPLAIWSILVGLGLVGTRLRVQRNRTRSEARAEPGNP